MSSEAQKRAKKKYDKANTQGIYLKMNVNTDKDILTHLDTKNNKQGYIKGLIRSDIENEKKATD